jgi:membrane protein DedA with SNARE-associated domain
MEHITYFVSHYRYLAIFILLMPGIFGIPLPDELWLTLVGYLALRGDLRLMTTLAVVVAGAILGITLDYWVGRAAGAKLIKEPGSGFRLGPDRFKRLQERLHRYSGWGLCLGYFIPGVRHWVAIAAGITKFPLAGFALYAYAGALAWSLLYIFLGYFLGQEAGLWVEQIGAHGRLAVGLIVALVLGYFLIRGKWLPRRRWPKISGSASTGR